VTTYEEVAQAQPPTIEWGQGCRTKINWELTRRVLDAKHGIIPCAPPSRGGLAMVFVLGVATVIVVLFGAFLRWVTSDGADLPDHH
jgi:hypothetical protein